MKLAYIAQFPVPTPYANSIQVMNMCAAFAERGRDVTLFVPALAKGADGGDPFAYYGLQKAFAIRTLSAWPGRGKPYAYAWRSAWAVRRLKPDLVYGRSLHGCLACCLSGWPTVFELHQPLGGRITEPLFRRLLRLPRFRHLVVISSSLKSWVVEQYGLAPDRVVVAHDAADIREIAPRVQDTEPDRIQVGYVGHLYPGRGIQTVLDLAEATPSADFHLVGGTEADIRYWKERVRSDNVRFHGHVPHARVPDYFSIFDIVVAPYEEKVIVPGGTDTSRWMSPLKIFEYMAAGKAILCSDAPVLREVLEDGRTALLIAPADRTAWINTLHRAMADHDLRDRLGANARRELENKYSWRERARRVLMEET